MSLYLALYRPTFYYTFVILKQVGLIAARYIIELLRRLSFIQCPNYLGSYYRADLIAVKLYKFVLSSPKALLVATFFRNSV